MGTNRIQNHNDRGSDVVLRVEGLYKKFCRTLKHSMYYGAIDSVRSMMGISYATDVLRKNEFWALNNISFEMKRGETLGLIGQNGSGKTTALRLINGIFQPDKGSIEIRGRISALIAVGAGFHPHMTGMENIYLNGTILGMRRKEIYQKLDSIIDFADIGDFLDAPVSTYSSGMRVRLGFAIAIHTYPDILLVDEILAVGDAAFRGKCANKIKDLQQQGVSIILVSHNELTVLDICTRAILFDHGSLLCEGDTPSVLSSYHELMVKNDLAKEQTAAPGEGIDTNKPFQVSLSLEDERGEEIHSISTGQSFYVVARIWSRCQMDNLRWTVSVQSKERTRLVYVRNDHYGIPAIRVRSGWNTVKVLIKNLNLSPGVYIASNYFLNFCSDKPFRDDEVIVLTVTGDKKNDALLSLDTEWHVD